MTTVESARLRAYNVGFGDCLLLSLTYGDATKRHVLIDFGSTEKPNSAPRDHMKRIAENIAVRDRQQTRRPDRHASTCRSHQRLR